MSDVAWLASARLPASNADPAMTTTRGPKRSDKVPQNMLAKASARNPMVMAVDTPVVDQPVSSEMGLSSTGNENMAPIATQPNRPPAATITQR